MTRRRRKILWMRNYFRQVRAVKLPRHEFVKSTCCGDCYRKYHRERMREYRLIAAIQQAQGEAL